MAKFNRKYKILRSSIRDHYEGRTIQRKVGPKTILINEKELKLVEYIHLIVEWDHSIIPTQVKAKVVEIIQERLISFTNGIPDKSYLKWFRARHPSLVLRILQGLDYKRVRAVNPTLCAEFYNNLTNLYDEHSYPPYCVWNIDETGCSASQSGLAKVFAKKDIKGVHRTILAEREWFSVLSTINASGETISNYHIFKGVRKQRNYVIKCEDGALQGMQKKGWMDSIHFF